MRSCADESSGHVAATLTLPDIGAGHRNSAERDSWRITDEVGGASRAMHTVRSVPCAEERLITVIT